MLYRYRCPFGHERDVWHSMTADKEVQCNHKGWEGDEFMLCHAKMRKVIWKVISPPEIIFKGDGWTKRGKEDR